MYLYMWWYISGPYSYGSLKFLCSYLHTHVFYCVFVLAAANKDEDDIKTARPDRRAREFIKN